MESKAKALGHPIHPMLIFFPLGLFVTAVICDVIYLINGFKSSQRLPFTTSPGVLSVG